MSRPREQPGGAGVITQRDLDASISLRRRARVAVAEARAHHATLTARLMTGYAVELGRYRPKVERVRFRGDPREGSIIFGIYEGDDPTPLVIDRFEPGEDPDAGSSPAQAEAEAHAET